MSSRSQASIPISKWRWQWLVLCIMGQLQPQLAHAQTAVQTLFVPDTDTVASFNVPPDSDDINLYVLTPDWYQYTAIGFGATMSEALMLVMYPSSDGRSVTVSPRKSTGNTEPVYSPETQLVIHDTSIDENLNMVINATCRRCLPYTKAYSAPGAERTASMMFAVGPDLALHSDELDARIRRHVAYGIFEIDLDKATGPGGIGPSDTITGGSGKVKSSSGDAVLSGERDGLVQDGGSKAATAHGVLYAVVALGIAPFDSLVAGALGRSTSTLRKRWAAWAHGFTATAYVAFVVGAMVPGILVSREHVATQQFRTGHQVLGLLTVAALVVMFVWGIALSWIRRSASQHSQEPPENAGLLGAIHRWGCRIIWVLLLINVGLGLKLSEQKLILIFGYVAVTLALMVVLIPVYFCLWRCSKRRKEKEESVIEMPTIYDHNSQPLGIHSRD
ncbi:hypothetical protein C7999DRAFT_12877 [Corynascus novoguineensis]|uniref:Cellobiose dehydrogenase-like cytochrome domain-containing protein n=1 Tax=Corynascus novoguineensis TaxID=1126955 RepID=A0AAN7HKT7_9PEZI|nr:hypothetical protein C7999DRAFT_12877 [Corynascus novoguineensis]